MELTIFTPPVADEADALDAELVWLTEAISQLNERRVAHGILGGEFGYGANWENDVFLMHPFCWCERHDCPWCAGCWCYENCVSDWGRSVAAGSEPYPKGQKCPWCQDVNQWPEKGSLKPSEPPHYGAPHFWHKPTGLRVWWYKWIGRDMIAVGNADISKIFAECAASLPSRPESPATAPRGEARGHPVKA